MSSRPGFIGVTTGLVTKCSDTEPEQVYVYQQEGDRPIRIEGWKGYSVPLRMELTRNQTYELQQLLVQALAKEAERE